MNRDVRIAEADGKKSANNNLEPCILRRFLMSSRLLRQPWLQLSTGAFPNQIRWVSTGARRIERLAEMKR
jgi:hypothetical protein